ncbi:MAG TPA: filamentous hemagglutinin N-terminal domain-containing protein [Stellaceae bacterium]|nr:filamentous hemagglutinin N-terminal domain-containing protein [Stellaceae bacterium]
MTKQILMASTALAGVLMAAPALAGGGTPALPQGGKVVSGSAVIKQVSPTELDITENPGTRTVIDWQSFNIGKGDKVMFRDAGSNATVNEVLGGGPSMINGTLLGNGLIALSNAYGINFGTSATVAAGSLIATTAGMSANDQAAFANAANGKLTFSRAGQGTAAVVNQGSLTVAENGLAALVAPGVANSGVINATLSKVSLASANSFFVDLYGDRLVSVAVPGSVVTQTQSAAAAIDNSGRIIADGGTVQMTANVARGVVSAAINLTGVVQARSISSHDGTVTLDGGQAAVSVNGTIDVSGTGVNEQGGSVKVKGTVVALTGDIEASGTAGGGAIAIDAMDIVQSGTLRADGGQGAGGQVAIDFSGLYLGTQSALLSAQGGAHGGSVTLLGASGSGLLSSGSTSVVSGLGAGGTVTMDATTINLLAATVDADGTLGGGDIAVGGGLKSGNLPAATTTNINGDSVLRANALNVGNGGRIVLWSSHETRDDGTLSARGGGSGGNGGRLEVSSDGGHVDLAGFLDVGARFGRVGSVVLDPTNITISDAGGPVAFALVDPAGGPGSAQRDVLTLSNGNVAAAEPQFQGNDVGAVVVYNGKTGGLISALFGVTGDPAKPGAFFLGVQGLGALTNGNFLEFDGRPGGEPILINGTTGTSGIAGGPTAPFISTSIGTGVLNALINMGQQQVNCFAGARLPASVCAGVLQNILTVTPITNPVAAFGTNIPLGLPNLVNVFFLDNFVALPNGNFVLNDLTQTIFGNGTTGATKTFNVGGAIGAPGNLISPCLVSPGSCGLNIPTPTAATRFITLANGNVVVTTGLGDTFLNSGANFDPNSVMANTLLGGGATIALANGNYVVDTPGALNGLGAITFGNGKTGVVGAITAQNSLTGAAQGDLVNSTLTALANGNYVVAAPDAEGTRGAVTLGNGTSGMVGVISAANSIVGTTIGDKIGSGVDGTVDGVVAAVSGGNFLVLSPHFDGGRGAATFVSAANGTAGTVSADNSLVGAAPGDAVGTPGGFIAGNFLPLVAALTTGNFILGSPGFNNGAGAATLITPTTHGVISAANSLIDAPVEEVVALATGNYLVVSTGAVTFGNGVTGVTGQITAANSLIGAGSGPLFGTNAIGAKSIISVQSDEAVNPQTDPFNPVQVNDFGVVALANGNYVVATPSFDGARGAVTFGNGVTGTVGTITAQNSLVGATPGDNVGGAVLALPTGNYVVASPFFTANGMTEAGAVTFGNGTKGTVGMVTAQNSLLGANPGDLLGFSSLSVLLTGAPGNPALNAAAIFRALFNQGVLQGGVGRNGIQDLASLGVTPAAFQVPSILVLANGDYVVGSPFADNGRGAVTIGSGVSGVSGVLSAQNSVIGTGGQFGTFLYDNPALGTAIAFGYSSDAVELAVSAKGINNLLGNANNFPGTSPVIAPGALQPALAGGGTVTLAAGNNITIASALDAKGGALVLKAGNDIVIDGNLTNFARLNLAAINNITIASVLDAKGGALVLNTGNGIVIDGDLRNLASLTLTGHSLDGSGSLPEGVATFNGLSLANPLVLQALTITGNVTQPYDTAAPVSYVQTMLPHCVTLQSDGSCDREPPKDIGGLLASRGNAYLGDLLYQRK